MKISRRQFLVSGGAAALATLAPGRLVTALDRAAAPPPKLSSWSDIRGQFRLDPKHLHFASFYIASHPRPVREAIEEFRRTLDADPFLTVERGLFESETANLQRRVLDDMAPYLGVPADQIALTPNTTTGLALVYHGLSLRPGDEVLATTHDHYSHHESIRLAAERSGATVRRVALYDEAAQASRSVIVERVRQALRPATRALGVTWVHSSTGVRLPIADIARVVREANAGRSEADRILLIVDGVHGLGAVGESVASLGCDFFSAGTHKWMFAPRGTGLLWGAPAAWARVRPTVPSFSSLEAFEAWMRDEAPPPPNTAARVAPGGFTAFEHQWAMGAAFRFHRAIGAGRVAGRIRELNDRCKVGLAKIPRVRLHTPRDPELSAGIVAFEVEGMKPEDVVRGLLERGIVASTSPYRVSYARLAPSLVNTEEEVETTLRAMRAIATA